VVTTVSSALAPLLARSGQAALLFDVDGTLAPIAERAQDARVPPRTVALLRELAERYALVACVSGRRAADARRLVGIEGIAYAGSHGGELLEPGAQAARRAGALEVWVGRIGAELLTPWKRELARVGVRVEDKDPIVALHWRGAPDEEIAQTLLARLAVGAEAAGLWTHWGRKVLELRPPVVVSKGHAVRALVERSGTRAALFGGDDSTDLDAFRELDALTEEGALDVAVRVGVRSDEGPAAIAQQADLVVDGTEGFLAVLEVLAAR